METAVVHEKMRSLKDPDVKAGVKVLSGADGYTNLWYLLRTWVYLIAVIGFTMWFLDSRFDLGISFWWNLPVVAIAIVLVGAGQHQLTGLAHEASHHILVGNRRWNDLLGDWLCMFPMFSSTHHYRLQHIAHHQFTNDPHLDPDVSQLQSSGHWLDFPLSKAAFLGTLAKQLWLPNLIRYIRIRATYNSLGTDRNPYASKPRPHAKINQLVGVSYLLILTATLSAAVHWGDWFWLFTAPLICGGAVLTYYALVPDHFFSASKLKPIHSPRTMALMRMTFFTLAFSAVAFATKAADKPIALWLLLLWVVPIFTSFSFFMVLRQLVQHGNADRGWLTNTRTFLVNPFVRFAVFPIGQDYHLPHHLFASVPHYKLKQLHELLMQTEEYRREATVVEGYFFPVSNPPRNPTVLEVVGPEYAKWSKEVHLDHTVLDSEIVEDKEELMQLASVSVKSPSPSPNS